MLYCCVPFCKSLFKKNSDLSFHEFPSNSFTRSAWLKAISRTNFYPNDKSNTSRVCSKHFKEDDYVPNTKYRRLKRTSVPSVFLSSNEIQVEDNKPRSNVKRPLDKTTSPSAKRKCLYTPNADVGDAELLLNFLETFSHKQSINFEPISADMQDTAVLFNFSETPSNGANEALSLNITETFPRESNINTRTIKKSIDQKLQTKMKMTDIEKLHHENRKLRKLLHKKNTDISSLKEKNKFIIDKLDYYENNIYFKNIEKMQVLDGEGLASTMILFILTLIKNFSRTPRWPESIIRECIMLRAVSPKGYKLIINRNLLKLPSITTLNRYIGPIEEDIRFTDLVKQRVEQEAQKLKPIKKMCSLIIDEMSIKP